MSAHCWDNFASSSGTHEQPTIGNSWPWERPFPLRPGGIGSYHVPPNSSMSATPRGLSFSTALHEAGNQMIPVPNLSNTRII